MAFYMDGQLLNTLDVETKPSKLVYFDPFSDGEMRVYLPEGDHVFRAAFLDDDFVKTVDRERTPTTTRRTSTSAPSPLSGRFHPRSKRPAARRF